MIHSLLTSHISNSTKETKHREEYSLDLAHDHQPSKMNQVTAQSFVRNYHIASRNPQQNDKSFPNNPYYISCNLNVFKRVACFNRAYIL